MKRSPNLELSWLRAFVAAADAHSFTSAGTGVGATQSAVSVRIRKLEQRLGQRLLDRNARSVTLTALGAAFLPDARRVLQMHDAAAMRALGAGRRAVYELGVSDHAAGRLLPQMLAPLKDLSDGRQLAVTVGTSRDLIAAFERGQYDAVIGRLDDVGGEGDTLLRDKLVWTASRALRWQPAEPMPFVSLSAPCGIRDIALSALATSGIQWRETFVGTGVAAIQAAVSAGFGVACLEKRNVPPDCKALAGRPRLPALPTTRLVIRIRDANPGDTNVARAIGSALKTAARATASKPSV